MLTTCRDIKKYIDNKETYPPTAMAGTHPASIRACVARLCRVCAFSATFHPEETIMTTFSAALSASATVRCARPFVRSALATALALAFPLGAQAAPTGGQVVYGLADITAGADTVIDQSSARAIIQWQGFSVDHGESVTFNQPSASAIALNRVLGNEKSVIDGALSANGQVFIVNSHGVLFGKNAQVDVGGLVASAHDIGDTAFLQGADNTGEFVFESVSAGEVENAGAITAAEGGYVALLGRAVRNNGHIVARKGTVALAAGGAITLDFAGADLTVRLDEGDYGVLAANGGVIEADGGVIVLTARAAEALGDILVNNTGVLRARTIADLSGGEHEGRIELVATNGVVRASGTLDVSAFVPASGETGSGETGSGETGSGETGSGETGSGETGSGETGSGETGSGETGGGETGSGETGSGETGSSETSSGETGSGETGSGETSSGETGSSETSSGETGSGETGSGETGSGETGSSETGSGETGSGETGDSGSESGSAAADPVDLDGGAILISGDAVLFDAQVDARPLGAGAVGTLRIEAADIAVGADGIDGHALGEALARSHLTLTARTGDIDIGAAIGWNADTTLSLSAGNDIFIDDAIVAGGAGAKLVLDYEGDYFILTPASFSGAEVVPSSEGVPGAGLSTAKGDTSGGVYGSISFSHEDNKNGLTINGQTYTLIHALGDMAATGTASSKYYALAGDIDATEWSAANTGKAALIGTLQNSTLAGLGHTIENLSLSNNTFRGNVGLIGTAKHVDIRDLGLNDVEVKGLAAMANVGSLAGTVSGDKSNFTNVYITGSVTSTGDGTTGGLIGTINSTSGTSVSIANAFADAVVAIDSTTGAIGGLVGSVSATNGALELDHVHVAGSVSNPSGTAGGLVGRFPLARSIIASYSTAAVSGSNNVGGLVGEIHGRSSGNAVVTDSFATGAVSGVSNVGGLIGLTENVVVNNVYATGAITVNDEMKAGSGIGGLIGKVDGNSVITYSHADGDISLSSRDTSHIGGLVGRLSSPDGSITHSYATGNIEGSAGVYSSFFFNDGSDKITNIYTSGYAGNQMGGLVGYSVGNISNSYASGNVQGWDTIGGLVGDAAAGVITDSFASGNVSAVVGVGGIAGYLHHAAIDGVTATGDVQGTYYVGGIVGILTVSSTIENSIADNTISGTGGDNGIGAIVGHWSNPLSSVVESYVLSTVSNNYYNQDKNPALGQIGAVNEGNTGMAIDGGGLNAGQLADDGVRDAIFNGGDVGGAIAAYDAGQAPAPSVPVSPPSMSNTPDSPVATTPPPTPDIPGSPIAVAPPPVAPDFPEVPVVPPTNPDAAPPSVIPVIPNTAAELETVRTAAAQVLESNRQLAGEVIFEALDKQIAGFEGRHIPLDQLMAHLTQASAAGSPTSAATVEREQKHNSNVDNIAVERECYSLRAEGKICE
jgi:filamentous hemagglutinin family protein